MSKMKLAGRSLPPELLALCPNTPPEFFVCAHCNKTAFKWRVDRQFAWGRVLYCQCGKDWIVCGFCETSQSRLVNARSISSHNRNSHSKKRSTEASTGGKPAKRGILKEGDDDEPTVQDNTVDFLAEEDTMWMVARNSPYKQKKDDGILLSKDGEDFQTNLFPTEGDGSIPPAAATSLRDFGNKNSSTYFNADINGSGVADIVGLCQFGISEVGKEIHPADVQYCADVANFVHGLNQSQRSDLAHILKGTVSKVKRDAKSNLLWITKVPTDAYQMRKQFWEGREAFLANIPTPSVESVGQHSYVSLRECIRNRLALGFPIEKVEIVEPKDNVRSVMQSQFCQQMLKVIQGLYEEPVLVLFLKEWQDDYDPHSRSKANRGSAWVKTVTIAEPHDNKNNAQVCLQHTVPFIVLTTCPHDCVSKFTYPIALGPAALSHETVEKRFSQELDELADCRRQNNIFYSKIHKKDIRVHVELICSLMDQPERRGTNSMLGGNAIYGARWGYTCNLQEIHHRLTPCAACRDKLIVAKDMSWNETSCHDCAQWDMDSHAEDDFLAWEPPPGFPDIPNHKGGLLRPRKLTYSVMNWAVVLTHENLVQGTWTKTAAELFLAYYGLNTKAQEQILRCAQNVRALIALTAAGSESSEDYQLILDRKSKYPEEFERWVPPTFWKRRLDLDGQIDAPMHLLFLGAVQGITGFVHSFLAKHGKFANFMRVAKDRLTCLVKFKLNWMKLLPYKGDALGGWVSENYVSLARISKWFYLIVDDLSMDEEPYKDPEGTPKAWTAVQNRAWLKARGLKTDGLAKDLRARVAETMAKGDVPLLPPPGGTTDDIHDLIDSMYEMVKSIMVFEVNDDIVKRADFCIKRFLTILVDCDKKVNPKKRLPFWISSYTYPCLLNIPASMRRYGPLKNLWEGGVRGERSLQDFKPLHASVGLRQGWPVQVMTRVLQKKALRAIGTTMEAVQDLYDMDDDEESDAFYSHARESYWKYPNAGEAVHDHFNYKPLCLVFDGDNYGAMTREGSVVKFICDSTVEAVTVRGMIYRSWRVAFDTSNLATSGRVILKDFIVVHSCILLPLHLKRTPQSLYENNHADYYAAIRDDYTMMDGSGLFH